MLAVSAIGSLPQWLTVVLLLAGGYLVTRGAAGPALEIERNANTTLRERNTELERQLADRTKEVAALVVKTDLAPLQQALVERLEVLGHEVMEHDRQAAERFRKMCDLLDLIAERLGPEPNGA